MKDKLYEEFYDPSDHFTMEPRAFCYDLATRLIDEGKRASGDKWYGDANTVKAVLLLLFTWNFAARETKRLDFKNVGVVLRKAKRDLRFLEVYSIVNADDKAWERVKRVFDRFKSLCGQTGASKALSLLNPHLFVMWDTGIRRRLNRELIRGVVNGQTGEEYVVFLKGIQAIIEEYGIAEKLPQGAILAKKLDEYNYVRIVMKKTLVDSK